MTDNFLIEFGENGWIRGMINEDSDEMDEWKQVRVTKNGVYLNGVLIAEGNLKQV